MMCKLYVLFGNLNITYWPCWTCGSSFLFRTLGPGAGWDVLSLTLSKNLHEKKIETKKDREHRLGLPPDPPVDQLFTLILDLCTDSLFPFNRSTTLGTFGVVAVAGFVWTCEWKDVLQYLPVYNKKYEHSTPK